MEEYVAWPFTTTKAALDSVPAAEFIVQFPFRCNAEGYGAACFRRRQSEESTSQACEAQRWQ
jgi:hypothetical protein